MNNRIITIKESKSGEVLASAEKDNGVVFLEGAWYFEPAAVNQDHLTVTRRTYICPYKGVCYWIDLNMAEHQARDVAWTYFEVKPGYEFIQDRIAFYAGRRRDTFDEG
jgi:uncharacterized protein (DUF427 family)